MTYETYLLTAHWRSMRNRALRFAGFKCSKCQSGRNLQVHHLSYARLGEEFDTDLEVLCRGCHLGLHVHEVKNGLGVYLKLISEALNAEAFTSVADLIEAVKARCARAKIPYYDGQIHAAIALLDNDKRLGVAMPKKYQELLDVGRGAQPFTHAEACGFIAQFKAQGLLKPMPTVKKISEALSGQADRGARWSSWSSTRCIGATRLKPNEGQGVMSPRRCGGCGLEEIRTITNGREFVNLDPFTGYCVTCLGASGEGSPTESPGQCAAVRCESRRGGKGQLK